MQLCSLWINVNWTRIINFSNISHTSHILGLSYLHNFFGSFADIRTADIRRDKDPRLQIQSASVLQRWGIHLQIPRAPGEDEQARCYETLHRVFLQKYMFFSCSSNPIIFLPKTWKKSQVLVKIQKNNQQRGSSPLLSSFPPTPRKCWHPAEVIF